MEAQQENLIEKLIEEVKQFTAIWNKQSDGYKDNARKQMLFQEIGERFGMPGYYGEIKNNKFNLLTNLLKNINKIFI